MKNIVAYLIIKTFPWKERGTLKQPVSVARLRAEIRNTGLTKMKLGALNTTPQISVQFQNHTGFSYSRCNITSYAFRIHNMKNSSRLSVLHQGKAW